MRAWVFNNLEKVGKDLEVGKGVARGMRSWLETGEPGIDVRSCVYDVLSVVSFNAEILRGSGLPRAVLGCISKETGPVRETCVQIVEGWTRRGSSRSVSATHTPWPRTYTAV